MSYFCIEQYLEDKYRQHPLLPKDLKKKALNLQVHVQFEVCLYLVLLGKASVLNIPDHMT